MTRMSVAAVPAVLAAALAAGCNCPGGDAAERARAEAAAARAEAEAARADLAAARAELDRVKAEADPKFARELAGHFLDGMAAENNAECRAVSTKEYAGRVNFSISGGPVRWAISSVTPEPGGDRLVFKGALSFESATVNRKRPFSLLVVKEEGKWKVAGCATGPGTD